MFDSGYQFRLATKPPTHINDYPLIEQFIYRFKTDKKRTYLVHLHKYDYTVFVIKFHDKKQSLSADKFNFVLNDFDCGRVLRTIIEIAMSVLANEQYASFAFVGAHKPGKESKQTINTQRFKIYKRMAEYFLGSITFLHVYEERSNCYILVNKKHANPEAIYIYESILEMFASQYPELNNI
jgi:hypothetical protein